MPFILARHEGYITLALLLIFCTLIFYLLGKQIKRISKANSIPGKKTIRDLPVTKSFPFWTPSVIEGLASAYRLHKDGVRIIYDLWASTNYSPLVSLTAPNLQKAIVVSEPELIKKCLSSRNSEFLGKPQLIYNKLLTVLVKDGLVYSSYNVWKPHRKILDKFFSYGMLQEHLKIVDKCAQQLIVNLDTINSSKIELDQLFPLVYNTTMKLIMEILIGPEIVAEKGIQEASHKFLVARNVMQDFLSYPFYWIEFLWKLAPKGKLHQEYISFILDYFDDSIDKRGKANGCIAIDHMRTNKMSNKDISRELVSLMAGSHETAELAIHLLMQHLGEHLNIQAKCQEEIDAIFSSKDCTYMTMADLSNLKYLEQCILETLRLTPIFPAFARELNGNIELDDVLIEKGTILLFCPWIVHRHPDIYPEAEKFDPDRFTQEKVQARHPYSFIPFSLGPRNCIGWKLALLQLKTIMFWILRHYNIRTKDKLADVKLRFEVSLMPERKFNISLEKRQTLT